MRRGITMLCLALGCSFSATGTGQSGGSDGSTGAGSSGLTNSGGTTGVTSTSDGSDSTTSNGTTTTVGTTDASATTDGDASTAATTTATTTTDTGSTGTTGDCDVPSTACLVGTGLIGRYFLDEADAGSTPTEVVDWAADPVNLGITWATGMSYTEVDGHRGIEWETGGQNGAVFASVAGTKLASIDGQTTATLEAVVDVHATTNGSRVIGFGEGSEGGLFTFRLLSLTQPRLWWDHETVMGSWTYDFGAVSRVVVHVVYESAQGDAADRRRLYVDGELVGSVGGNAPSQNEAIDLSLGDPEFALGNRANGSRAIDGVLYYAALYDAALTTEEIAANVAILSVDDDRP